MKIFEVIEDKYFILKEGAMYLLEVYHDPQQELDIQFDLLAQEYNDYYYKAIITDKQTHKGVVAITFTLYTDGRVDFGNIEPLRSDNKIVHTSAGSQQTGVDFGRKAVKWAFEKIKEFALSKGIAINRIKSQTRYTGARAYNNPGVDDGLPKHFNIDKPVTESIHYDCVSNTFEMFITS